jgi:FAD/FMN-containing dehydrogenase/Fe-S oxidoreductase
MLPPQPSRPPIDYSGLSLTGELHTGDLVRRLYATDASEFQEMPAAVAIPANEADVRQLVTFAHRHRIGLIPRAAGTSLAGQVVGNGIVVDAGRHLNRILAIDVASRQVRVQPGVIRNDLNRALQPHGLLFGPETSTANRAMIGGMAGNNACGSNSLVYGSVRDHLVAIRGLLSDGSEVTFGPLDAAAFTAKCTAPDCLETRIYRHVRDLLSNPANRQHIRDGFPKPDVTRRNTGYALDALMDCSVFEPDSIQPFNLCRLIAGSEGTLFFGLEYTLNCEPLPPPGALMCAHFQSVIEALHANLLALRFKPSACELIDRHILACTQHNIEQRKNRFFVDGDPGAILVIEIQHTDPASVSASMRELEAALRAANLGYHFPVLWGDDCTKVWDLRRAGQGVMTNVVGDVRPAEVVEDTAVAVADLPAYITEFDALMRHKYGIECVYYAHAGSGELHTRPLINLKTEAGHRMFRAIAEDIAALVRKYKGSLSGEHGDGRLRGEFIHAMVGDECYALMRTVKQVFDPHNVFNPGKVIDTPPMDQFHRYAPGHPTPDYPTIFDFSDVQGVLRAAEKCNGSGDCRKTQLSGGTMCPSYMATRDEKDSTRGRANILRHMLTYPPDPRRPMVSPQVKEVMDLCLSCKGCKSECPSNVDIAKLKAEFLQHWYDAHGVPLRTRLIAHYTLVAKLASYMPWAWNAVFGTSWLRRAANRMVGFHPDRTIPLLPRRSFDHWWRQRVPPPGPFRGRVLLFVDEFTRFQDVAVGIAAVELLDALGFAVEIPPQVESGRAALSKGLLRLARKRAATNVRLLAGRVSADTPLVGIEPSAILSFRDEYPDLLRGELQQAARGLASNCLQFDEFVARAIDAGTISSSSFTDAPLTIKLHGHCQQKAIASLTPTMRMLKLPANYRVQLINSGCCGMAGSFGYEREHFDLSQQVGELVLLPAVRATQADVVIAAPGTSCRHQIHDGAQRIALHPIQILRQALRNQPPTTHGL